MKRFAALLLTGLLLCASCACAEPSVVIPEGYVQGDPLPIYRATPRTEKEASFLDHAQPEWFNASGVASYENTSRRARCDLFVFNDEAQLTINNGYIDYREYDGVHYAIDGDAPDQPRGPFARPSFACEIGWLASNARLYQLWGGEVPDVQLEQTELKVITLAQARETVEGLLTKLGLTGYELSYALDMSAAKIRLLGAWNEKLRKEYYNGYDRYWDFSKATEADEGYYLFYERIFNGARADELDGDLSLDAYVDGNGLVFFQLRDAYAPGDVYETPKKLMTADEIFECFAKDNPRRAKALDIQPEIIRVELMYAPVRASNKKDGTVFAPVWYVTYTRDHWAWYSAVDGTLVADCYS